MHGILWNMVIYRRVSSMRHIYGKSFDNTRQHIFLKTYARKSRSQWSLNCICTDSVSPRCSQTKFGIPSMRGSRNFRQGGSRSVCLKTALTTFFFFFSPQLILQKLNGQFQRNLSFVTVPEGVQHFPGWGVQLLIPYSTHITCDFPGGGGSGPPVPPSGFALA